MNDKEYKFDLFGERQKTIRIALLAIPLLLIIPMIIILTNKTFVLFPGQPVGTSTFAFEAFADTGYGGGSTVEDFHFDSKNLVCSYTLRRKIGNPIVFISMWLDKKGIPLDLSGFSSVTIRFEEVQSKRITVFFKTFVPGISIIGPENAPTLRHNQFIIHPNESTHEYKIDFDRFFTDNWWYSGRGITPNSLPEETYSKVMGFDILFSPSEADTAYERHERIVLDSVVLERGLSPFVFIIPAFMAVYYLLFGIMTLFRKKNVQTLPERKTVEVSSYKDDELKRINQFIETHYTDPDISTSMIYKELGINTTRVFNLLKKKYNLSFKQLINRMRIEEAKKLLRETDLKVLAIAFNLGFNDISYFNRLFKQEEGVAPSDYRDKNTKEESS